MGEDGGRKGEDGMGMNARSRGRVDEWGALNVERVRQEREKVGARWEEVGRGRGATR